MALSAKTALTSKDLDFLQQEIPILISKTANGILSSDKIYAKVKDKLENKIDEALFVQSLNNARQVGLLTGFIGRRGKSGGLMIDKAPVKPKELSQIQSSSETEETAPDSSQLNIQEITDPKDGFIPNEQLPIDDGLDCLRPKAPVKFDWNQAASYTEPKDEVFILAGKEYHLAWSKAKINNLITNVFKAIEDDNGTLIFNDKKYFLPSQESIEIFDRYAFFILEAGIVVK